MNDTLICITTYKKLPAIDGALERFVELGYHKVADFVICDDDNGSAKEVYEKFKDKCTIFYSTGPNAGIAKNKNRGIKVFLEEGKWKYLILIDDDIKIPNYGLVEEFIQAYEEDGEEHINTFLGGYKDPVTGDGFFQVFPVMGKTENVVYTKGVQGVCCFYTRQLVEKIGYFSTPWPYRYGFEHVEYSARANRVKGKCPEWFCSLRESPSYIACAGIANGYEVDNSFLTVKDGKVGKQLKTYSERLANTYKGLDLKWPTHGLDLKKEVLIKP